jgi:hypothetical protein
LNWLTSAQECFRDDFGTLRQGLLASVFSLVVGIERMFHLDEVEDVGFALLCGGRRCPSRHTVGGWRRHLPWYGVDAFCRRTSPWHLLRDRVALVGYDEHAIPRWTHKFEIGKGYVTTRNKYMRCEKLFYTYDLIGRRFLAVRGAPGDVNSIDLAVPLTRQTLERGQPEYMHALFDAGAGKRDAGVRALWDLVEEDPRLDVTVRACRYPHRLRRWKQLPSGLFVSHEEPGPYVGAPPKEVRLAEAETVLKGETADRAIRTVVCREVVPGPKKDRRHPLFTTSAADPLDVLTIYRGRQGEEQAFRVGVYDESLDAVPCGYDKESPDPKRPRFHRGPLQMMGWLVALVYNALADWAGDLAGDWGKSQVRTLRRTFIDRPGWVYGTPTSLVVRYEPFAGQEALVPAIDKFNAAGHRIPWLGNRRLVLCLTPHGRATRGP